MHRLSFASLGLARPVFWALFVGLSMLCVGLLAATLPAYAYDPLKDACSSAGASSTACQAPASSSNPLTGPNGTIIKVANVVALFGGVAAIIIMVISGIRFATSNGDAQDVSNAKKGIISALIGLVVIAVARLIVSLVAKGVS